MVDTITHFITQAGQADRTDTFELANTLVKADRLWVQKGA
jgi:hypothetical protein